MLFNSYFFIFLYLPFVLVGYYLIARINHKFSAAWLAIASLFFYAYWNPIYIFLLMSSIICNYAISLSIISAGNKKSKSIRKKQLLIIAIVCNFLLLGYYKYANFFINSFNSIADTHFSLGAIILPLGISFFTFTQLAFLVDTYQGKVKEHNFIHYLLFVTYFPHLIAGPVLHHKQMMPQFANSATYRINYENLAVGVSIFVLGLAKKVVIADSLAEYATPIFKAVSDGQVLMLFEAWIGAITYAFQLYFDFSGYSDMAIGISLMFNVRLPLNFNSPYKATNIIDFWRRWHITLSTFLRDYLYFSLGGNRKGVFRRYINLMITMLLGGLWHGAGWTFIAWGGLHGIYLMINHGWRELKTRFVWMQGVSMPRLSSTITFVAIIIAWVFFRSESFTAAWSMLSSMTGINGISIPSYHGKSQAFIEKYTDLNLTYRGLIYITHLKGLGNIIISMIVIWFFPNVEQLFKHYKPTWDDMNGTSTTLATGRFSKWLDWKPTAHHAIAFSIIFIICIISLTRVSEFIYFQF